MGAGEARVGRGKCGQRSPHRPDGRRPHWAIGVALSAGRREKVPRSPSQALPPPALTPLSQADCASGEFTVPQELSGQLRVVPCFVS